MTTATHGTDNGEDGALPLELPVRITESVVPLPPPTVENGKRGEKTLGACIRDIESQQRLDDGGSIEPVAVAVPDNTRRVVINTILGSSNQPMATVTPLSPLPVMANATKSTVVVTQPMVSPLNQSFQPVSHGNGETKMRKCTKIALISGGVCIGVIILLIIIGALSGDVDPAEGTNYASNPAPSENACVYVDCPFQQCGPNYNGDTWDYRCTTYYLPQCAPC